MRTRTALPRVFARHGFSTRYRFTRTGGPKTFRFRALVRKQIGYAYSTGSSPSRRVRVTGH